MLESLHIIKFILPFFYLMSMFIYLFDFINEKKVLSNSKRLFLFGTLLIHFLYLIMRTFEFNHPPITSKFEIFSVLAFSIACSYFILELLTDVRATGLFIIPFSLIFQVISSLFIRDTYVVNEVLRNQLLGLHVTSALLGYSGFTISAVYSVLFLSLYRKLKGSNFGLIFKRMPSLETLEKLSYNSVVIGFVLLTIAMSIGAFWLPKAFPEFKFTDPKLISSAIVWLMYAIGITTKFVVGWYGKKAISLTLIGYFLAISSLLLFNLFGTSFHSFY